KRKRYLPILGVCLFAIAPAVWGQAQPAQGQQQPVQGQQQATQAQSAQEANRVAPGTIAGRVNGVGMEGATVTITSEGKGATQSTVLDSNLDFSFPNLAPGSYRIAVKPKSGEVLRENTIQLTTSGPQFLTFAADVTTGTVELEGAAPTLETETAEVSRT